MKPKYHIKPKHLLYAFAPLAVFTSGAFFYTAFKNITPSPVMAGNIRGEHQMLNNGWLLTLQDENGSPTQRIFNGFNGAQSIGDNCDFVEDVSNRITYFAEETVVKLPGRTISYKGDDGLELCIKAGKEEKEVTLRPRHEVFDEATKTYSSIFH